jgi:hypothetical protein
MFEAVASHTIRSRTLRKLYIAALLALAIPCLSAPGKEPLEESEVDRIYYETNVEELLSIARPKDVGRLRAALIGFLWGEAGLPSSTPSKVSHDFDDCRYDDISSLDHIDRITVEMEFGLESYVYHFFPKQPNGKVGLFHEGHGRDFYRSSRQIGKLLDHARRNQMEDVQRYRQRASASAGEWRV